ncbi:hypothetical protein T10_7585 [Trichinella papuae]|uniref:Integrase catalytic domain-containing protein n=1 Tax=Trichinella papuae TaxID=268474 RepID=A0A0V1MZS1_9BILA|nr:hypothetical protein T10_7585 [Trichinella papuae]
MYVRMRLTVSTLRFHCITGRRRTPHKTRRFFNSLIPLLSAHLIAEDIAQTQSDELKLQSIAQMNSLKLESQEIRNSPFHCGLMAHVPHCVSTCRHRYVISILARLSQPGICPTTYFISIVHHHFHYTICVAGHKWPCRWMDFGLNQPPTRQNTATYTFTANRISVACPSIRTCSSGHFWPVRDIIATTMARTFFNNWIARFGVPSRLTTDRDKQFDSNTWATLNKMLLGCRHIRSST